MSPRWVPVRISRGAIAAPGRIHAVLPGGLLIESTWSWPRGSSVGLELLSPDDEPGPTVRATIVGERGDVYLVEVASEDSEFVLEVRSRIES
jgi:hypothetical protein